MSNKLLPCPFCGGEAELRHAERWEPYTDERGVYYANRITVINEDFQAQCPGCGVLTKLFATAEEAIVAWNRRAGGWILVDYFGEPHEVLLPYFAGYDGTNWNDGDGQTVPFEVTHWMPLPAPPGLEG